MTATGPIIASIASHSTGKNLQDRWSKCLVVSPPASGKLWEQALGRIHRAGQKADTVECYVWTHAPELVESLRKARALARYVEQTIGSRQKLCFADIAIDLGEE